MQALSGLSSALRRGKKISKRKSVSFKDMKGFVEDLTPGYRDVVEPAAQFIKKNWKSRTGGSLLVETGSKMFPSKKRRRSRSRSIGGKRPKRSNSRAMVVYDNARRGAKSAVRRPVRRFRRFKTKRLGGLVSAVKRAMLSQPFVLRRLGSVKMPVTENKRSGYQGRLYNHSYSATGNVAGTGKAMDFGTFPTDNPAFFPGTKGFLYYLPHQTGSTSTTLQDDNDNFQQAYGYFHQWNSTSTDANPSLSVPDVDRLIRMAPLKAHFHWKNNCTKDVTMYFYVFKAKRDIPASAYGNSLYSPANLWADYMAIGGVSADIRPSGRSNIAGPDVVWSPISWMSDARSEIRRWYTKVMYRKVHMQPGDESQLSVTQPGKTFSLRDLQFRHVSANTNFGMYALRGDYLVFTMLRGGISHDEGPLQVNYGGAVAPQGVDLIVTKTFKGQLLPQSSFKHNMYFNDTGTLTTDGEQVLPSYSV